MSYCFLGNFFSMSLVQIVVGTFVGACGAYVLQRHYARLDRRNTMLHDLLFVRYIVAKYLRHVDVIYKHYRKYHKHSGPFKGVADAQMQALDNAGLGNDFRQYNRAGKYGIYYGNPLKILDDLKLYDIYQLENEHKGFFDKVILAISQYKYVVDIIEHRNTVMRFVSQQPKATIENYHQLFNITDVNSFYSITVEFLVSMKKAKTDLKNALNELNEIARVF